MQVHALAHEVTLSEPQRRALLAPLCHQVRAGDVVTILRATKAGDAEPFTLRGQHVGRLLEILVLHQPSGDGTQRAIIHARERGMEIEARWTPPGEDGANGQLGIVGWEQGRAVVMEVLDLDAAA